MGALTLAACSSSPEDGTAQSDGPVEISFHHFFTGPDRGDIDALITRFNDEHPDIQVVAEAIDGNTLADQLPSLVAAGQAPDVEVAHEATMPALAVQGALDVLDESALADAGIDAADYFEPAWEGGAIQDARYGIPFAGSVAVMFYNNERMAEMGVTDVPTTQEELVEAGQMCTTDNQGLHPDEDGFDVSSIATYGAGIPVEWAAPIGQSALAQYGAGLFDENFDPAFDSAESVAAMESLHALAYETIIGPPGIGFEADLARYRAGESCFMLTGSWEYRANVESGQDFGVAFMPEFGGTQPATNGGWNWFVMPRQDDSYPDAKRAAATTFVEWMTEFDAGLAWADTGNLPARYDVAESEEYSSNPMSAVAQQLDAVYVATGAPWVNQVTSEFREAYTATMSDADADVAGILEDAAGDAQSGVDDARLNYPDFE